jgi:2-oxoacid:acceptor oxidoreductase gamma subunit (pyruvate/2-ketoisovalerate family)
MTTPYFGLLYPFLVYFGHKNSLTKAVFRLNLLPKPGRPPGLGALEIVDGCPGSTPGSAENVRCKKVEMIEIRIHGRGGQGTVVAADLLALAFSKEGRFVQSFPSFGPERRSAPLATFVRVDDTPIRLRCEIYNPNHLIVTDSSLLASSNIVSGLRDGGWIIINSRKHPASFGLPDKFHVATIDADSIAFKHNLGTKINPIANTTMLGAFTRITGLISINAVVESLRETMTDRTEANIAAAREGYDNAS